MSRHILTLTKGNRSKAVQGVLKAPDGYVLELREPKRTDDQNSALWGLLNQIQRQRPKHNGVSMTPDTWKAVFLQALGAEMVFVPTLDGTGMFPLGHRSSQLTKAEFSGLLELMLAWCAEQKIEVQHFDDGRDATGGGESLKPVADAA